jgi:hypothetical protein
MCDDQRLEAQKANARILELEKQNELYLRIIQSTVEGDVVVDTEHVAEVSLARWSEDNTVYTMYSSSPR